MRLIQPLAATLLVATPLAFSTWTHPADAASSLQTLIATAEHDTNTVRTLIHTDQDTTTTPSVTVKVSARGSEDEVHNREQDYESVSVKGRAANGKVQSLQYTANIIFVNGTTYYRTTLAKNQWKSQKGMSFSDPFTGGWQRGRTTVPRLTSTPALKNVKLNFQKVGMSGSETHVRSTFSISGAAGTVDMWISGGSTPYVVREVDAYHSTKGPSGSATDQVSLGPFNTTIVIEPPTSQGTT